MPESPNHSSKLDSMEELIQKALILLNITTEDESRDKHQNYLRARESLETLADEFGNDLLKCVSVLLTAVNNTRAAREEINPLSLLSILLESTIAFLEQPLADYEDKSVWDLVAQYGVKALDAIVSDVEFPTPA